MNVLLSIVIASMAAPAIAASASWPADAPPPIQLVCNAKDGESAKAKCYSESHQRFAEQNLGSINQASLTPADADRICRTLDSTDQRICLSFYHLQGSTEASRPERQATPTGPNSRSGDNALQALFNGSGRGEAVPAVPDSGDSMQALMNNQIAQEKEQARQQELERQQEELHQKQLAAERAAADAARRIAQAQADAERAQAEAQEQANAGDDTGSMLMGLAFGAMIGKATGSTQLASQAATMAGVDSTAANFGAGAAIQQQQQAAAALAQIKEQQQALAAKIAAERAAQREAERAAQAAALQSQQNQQKNIVVAQLPPQPPSQRQFIARPMPAATTPQSTSSVTLYAGNGPNGTENPSSCISSKPDSERVWFTNSCQNTNIEVDVCGIRTRGLNEYGMADRSSRGAITLYHQGMTGTSGFWEFRSDGANPDTSYVWSASYCRVQPNFLNGAQNCPAACPSDPSPEQAYPQNTGQSPERAPPHESQSSAPEGAQPAPQQNPSSDAPPQQ